eukprot:2100799-Heterocapsa_arctica.AAC.1
MEKVHIIKTGGQSNATYGASVGPFTQADITSLRNNLFYALWPKPYMSCRATGLMLADKGELEPKLAITTKGIGQFVDKLKEASRMKPAERWEQYAVYTGNARGPINYFRREIKYLGWIDTTPTSITDHTGLTRDINDLPSFVRD